MTFALYTIDTPKFRFSASDATSVSADKFRGLQKFGPYEPISLSQPPIIGFVFPKHLRDLANRLYLAIRNGVGPYHGFSSMFRAPLEKDQVFQISDFSISNSMTHSDRAKRYADAIVNWKSSGNTKPDVFIVLHPRSASWEEDTPYYQCKSLLLQEGLLSQDVTTELIDHPTQFDWSVANIALATFVKLGGIPWIVDRRSAHREIVLGVGQTHLVEPDTRKARRLVAFTVGLRGDGPFEFTSVAQPAENEADYLKGLGQIVEKALNRIQKSAEPPDSITLHLSKEFGKAEAKVIDQVVSSHGSSASIVINVLKITDDKDFFAVDTASKEGTPARGTCIQVAENDYLLYTEGREEKMAWRNRLPTGLRIRSYGQSQPVGVFRELLSQVYDLSQVNYRGFNASSRPVSLAYSKLIARLLAHVPLDKLSPDTLDIEPASHHSRMWFL